MSNASLEFAIDNPDYLVVTGSRLYGCERYNPDGSIASDLDLRGVTVPPLGYLIGLDTFEEGTRAGDHKVYSVKRFFEMLVKGNAQAVELLFAPPSHVLHKSAVGERIVSVRALVLGKQYYNAITGYAYSEWNKVRGVKLEPAQITGREKNAIDALWNAFPNLGGDGLNQIKKIAYGDRPMSLVDAKSDVGEKRRGEYDRYGYCATCAHHALRMLYQCEELLLHGHMTFPRPERVLLSQVKRGEVPLAEVEAMHADLRARVDAAHAKSTLPDGADRKGVKALLREITLDAVRSELSRS